MLVKEWAIINLLKEGELTVLKIERCDGSKLISQNWRKIIVSMEQYAPLTYRF
jgi:hypothetical protein